MTFGVNRYIHMLGNRYIKPTSDCINNHNNCIDHNKVSITIDILNTFIQMCILPSLTLGNVGQILVNIYRLKI